MGKSIEFNLNEDLDRRQVAQEAGFHPAYLLDFYNERLLVNDLELLPGQGEKLFTFLEREALNQNLGKVIVLAHAQYKAELENSGFVWEGRIPGYYDGGDAHCFAIFTEDGRQSSRKALEEDCLLAEILARTPAQGVLAQGIAGYDLIPARIEQAEELARLYDAVFSYPTPDA